MTTGRVALEGGARVVARSDFRLGFDTPDHRPFREELRAACRGLSPRPTAILRATYAHPLGPDLVDLENVSLYNLGTGCLAHVAGEGVILERAPGLAPDDRFDPTLTHELSYEVTHYSGWTFWKSAGCLYDIVLPDRASLRGGSAKKVWAAARRAPIRVNRVRAEGPILVEVTAGNDSGQPLSLLGVMKPLVDGLLAAGHSYRGEELAELALRSESIETGLDPQTVEGWLSPWEAPLGPWRFLFPRGAGLQMSPADDRIVGLRMTRVQEPGVRFSVSMASPVE